MADETKTCNTCGAVCDADDKYCKECSASLNEAGYEKDSAIYGIPDSVVKGFVGKNSDYYLKKFKKSRGKRIFAQLNFPALLLGQTWFAYRKMYKFAIIYMVSFLVLSSILTVGLSAIFNPDVERFFEAKQAYIDFDDDAKYIVTGPTAGEFEKTPEFAKVCNDLAKVRDKLRIVNYCTSVPILILQIFVRLLGNCIYKKRVMTVVCDPKNTTPEKIAKKGGTSTAAAWITVILFNIVITDIVSFLLHRIPFVLAFDNAVDSFWAVSYWV